VKSVLTATLLLVASAAWAQGPTAPRLNINPSFFGSVPDGTATSEPVALTIIDAITRSLQHNLGLLMTEETAGKAQGARWQTLANLLPNISGGVQEVRQVINLAAYGFPLPPGTPTMVGPFNVFDARVRLSQSIVNLEATNADRAARYNLEASQHDVSSARDLVVLASTNAYLQALAAAARVESVRAQLESAEALSKQAGDLKESGLVAGIDVLRAEVQLSTQRQRATAAKNEFDKSKLQLARVIGLPIGQTFTLSDALPSVPAPDLTLEQALDEAYKTRPDYQAALERIQAAEAERRAVASEHLPSVRLNADYGALGLKPSDAEATWTVAGAVDVPIFNGGRTKGRQQQADAALRQLKAAAEDLRAEVDYDVRTAFLDLQATSEQLQVATRARELAQQQLTQARDRFSAGVTNNIEVVQAQQAVAESSEQYISALYGYNVAKALLSRGIGIAEAEVHQSVGGRP
jgi:outer membrane protein TolC